MEVSVAKSYEKCEILRGPYEKDKRFYVEVAYKCCSKKTCQKCGGKGFYPKEVRWYNDKIVCDVKGAFGFRNEKEQIFLCCGDEEFLSKYFLEIAPRTAHYNLLFGWFVDKDVPSLPKEIILLPLSWSEISNNDTILPYDKVREIVLKKKGAKN